jgi:cystathionine beta-lyase
MHDDTLIVTAGRHPEAWFGMVNPPVCRASTILKPTLQAFEAAKDQDYGATTYGRRGTPTVFCLAEAIAALEGGHACALFPSGLAAVTTSLLAFLSAGDHALLPDSVYGPARNFCHSVLERLKVGVTYYDPLIGARIAGLMRPETRVVYLESPGSLTFEVQDVPAIAAAARARGATVMMDNTWASPLFFKPLAHGVDVSIQSATKYIVGHSDAMLGAVTATRQAWPTLLEAARRLGQIAGAEEAYLGHRGFRTLGVRLRQHQANGLRLAEWLAGRPEVARVLHPALPGAPGHALWRRDFTGASGLFAVVLKPVASGALAAMVDGLRHFGMGGSWGGYESLVFPANPAALRSATAWTEPGPLLRVHAGLEDPEDLVGDLEAGFRRLRAAA